MTEEMRLKLEKLLESYAAFFDIRRDTLSGGVPFEAEADFHSRSERYVLVKSAKLWAAESHEYVFISARESLGPEEYAAIKSAALETGLARVAPHSEHMYTYITLVLLADELSAETAAAIRRSHFRKSYRFSLYGWAELRVAALELSTGKAYFNAGGRPLKKLLGNI